MSSVPPVHTGQCQVSHLSTLYNTKCPTGHTGQCQAFHLTTLNKGLVSHLSTQDNIVHFWVSHLPIPGNVKCPACPYFTMSSVHTERSKRSILCKVTQSVSCCSSLGPCAATFCCKPAVGAPDYSGKVPPLTISSHPEELS